MATASRSAREAGANAGPMLQVTNLDVYYGRAHALQGVSFTLDGGVFGIVGRNGMGKTTLCNAIMQMHAPRSGSVVFEGTELVGRPSYTVAGTGLAYVPQGRRLFESLTVDEHLRMAAPRRGDHRWTPDAVYELFPRLAQRRANGGTQLSGGEQQMLAIGRALMARPRLLLLDEPSMGISPILTERIYETIAEINKQGTTILLVEQNANFALGVSHRGYVLETGKVVLSDESARLRESPEVREAYLGG